MSKLFILLLSAALFTTMMDTASGLHFTSGALIAVVECINKIIGGVGLPNSRGTTNAQLDVVANLVLLLTGIFGPHGGPSNSCPSGKSPLCINGNATHTWSHNPPPPPTPHQPSAALVKLIDLSVLIRVKAQNCNCQTHINELIKIYTLLCQLTDDAQRSMPSHYPGRQPNIPSCFGKCGSEEAQCYAKSIYLQIDSFRTMDSCCCRTSPSIQLNIHRSIRLLEVLIDSLDRGHC